MTEQPEQPRIHGKHDDWWCECGLRVEDCDDLQEQLAQAAAPEQDEAVRQAIGIVESSRQTHVHWAEWRRGGGTGDDMAGDLAHHEEAIKGYDFVLSVLRAALASPPPVPAALDVEHEGWLRTFLWWNHGHRGPALYGDDGELQCKACGHWDYRREPLPVLIGQAQGHAQVRDLKAAADRLSHQPEDATAAVDEDEEHGMRVGELWVDRQSRPERAWVHHEGLWQRLDRVPVPVDARLSHQSEDA